MHHCAVALAVNEALKPYHPKTTVQVSGWIKMRYDHSPTSTYIDLPGHVSDFIQLYDSTVTESHLLALEPFEFEIDTEPYVREMAQRKEVVWVKMGITWRMVEPIYNTIDETIEYYRSKNMLAFRGWHLHMRPIWYSTHGNGN